MNVKRFMFMILMTITWISFYHFVLGAPSSWLLYGVSGAIGFFARDICDAIFGPIDRGW